MSTDNTNPPKRRKRPQKQYKRVKHQQANRLLAKLDQLVVQDKLVQLNFSKELITAVEAQKTRQIRAAAGVTQCYETFSGDPNFYIYDVDPASGTMTPANPPYQSTKPHCPACG